MQTRIINRRRAFWVSLAIGLLLIVVVAFFTHGGTHGMSADDYVYQSAGCAWSAGGQGQVIEHRIASISLAGCLARLVPNDELPLRVGLVAIHLLNVLLLGWLAWRLTGSLLVTLLSGGLFLVPLLANEGIVWFSGAIFYTLPLLLLLAGLHLMLTFRTFPGQYLLYAGAVGTWGLMVLFIEAGILVPFIVPFGIWITSRRGLPVRRRAWIAPLALYALLAAGYLLFIVRGAPIVALHGETTIDPAYILSQRIPETVDSLGSFLGQWQVSGPMFDALDLGLHEWLTGTGMMILGVLGLALVFAAALYTQALQAAPRQYNSLLLSVLGLGWLVLALAPVLFIRNLTISSRVLLFPSAGMALAIAGLCGWLIQRFSRWERVVPRVVLLLAAIVILLNTFAMAGITRVYQLRWELDQKQVQMLHSGMPQLPSPVWLLPLGLNNRSVTAYWNRETVLDDYRYGLFQIPWAAVPALRMRYAQSEINMVDRDMQGRARLTGIDQEPGGAIRNLTFQGASAENQIPVDQIIAFTFRQDHLVLLNPLVITGPSGRVEVNLPLARNLPSVASQPWELVLEESK